MSFFEHLMKLNELQVNGEQIGEDDDFDMGDDDQTADDTPDPNTNPSDTANAEAENQDNDTSPENNDESGSDTQQTDDEDDFTLDDDGEEAMDNTTTDDAGNDEGDAETPDDNTDTEQQDDSGDTTAGGDTGDDGGDDDFSMDDGGGDTGGENDDASGEGGEDTGTNDNNDSGSGDNNTPSDPTDGVSDEEQRAAEEEMYDSLTDDQKRIRTLQLKIDYKDLYETFINSLDGVSNIPKTSDNLETIKRLNTLLTKAKSILISYIRNNLDQNTYLENYTMYLKYLAVFRTAAKVIEELNNTDDKKSKKK